jgi:hypothetical protein
MWGLIWVPRRLKRFAVADLQEAPQTQPQIGLLSLRKLWRDSCSPPMLPVMEWLSGQWWCQLEPKTDCSWLGPLHFKNCTEWRLALSKEGMVAVLKGMLLHNCGFREN